jgi:hypothetical protein
MAEQGPNPGSAHDLIRIGVTLAAVAVALAAFQRDEWVAPFYLVVGLAAVVGTGYALAALWRDAGMDIRNLFTLRPPAGSDNRFPALIFLTWAMILLLAVYLAMLFTTTPGSDQ